MSDHKIIIEKSAAYQTFGNPLTATKLIFALHGYGQLTEFFIRKFQHLSSEYFIITPEGFHRFYLKGSSGRVGASWMTKENRSDDIKDNIKYLNQLYHQFDKYQFDEKILLGFSQGGATASRWHDKGDFGADKFVLWASVFPPDLDQEWPSSFQNSTNIFVIGSEDKYYTSEKIEMQKSYFLQNKVAFKTVIYVGDHSINPDILREIL